MKERLLNTLTIFALLASLVVIVIYLIIFFNPTSPINPYPPKLEQHDAIIEPVVVTSQPTTNIDPPTERPNPTPSITITLNPSQTATESPTSIPTSTPTSTPTSIFIAIIGDYGLAGQAEEEVANLVRGWNPDLILTTGDNNYPSGSASTIDKNIGQYYADYIYPYQGSYSSSATYNRFFPSLGNHDWRQPNAQPYMDYFTLPGKERYYSFTFGSVSFFAIDSDTREPDGSTPNSLQAQWLQLSLAASDSPWKIVYFHHAPYSSGAHGSTERMQWPFERWGASAVISGHDHLYERLIIRGIPYFVNGAGGKSLYKFTSVVPGSVVRFNNEYGAMLVEADPQFMIFKFITKEGKVIDDYEIQRVTPTPAPTEPQILRTPLP